MLALRNPWGNPRWTRTLTAPWPCSALRKPSSPAVPRAWYGLYASMPSSHLPPTTRCTPPPTRPQTCYMHASHALRPLFRVAQAARCLSRRELPLLSV